MFENTVQEGCLHDDDIAVISEEEEEESEATETEKLLPSNNLFLVTVENIAYL